MRPLDPLPALEALLKKAPSSDVLAALAGLDAEALEPLAAAARSYGHAALAARDGRFAEAREGYAAAERAFLAAGEGEAGELCRAEYWLSRVRRGAVPADSHGAGAGYALAIEAFERLAAAASSRRVEVVATHYLGVARRFAGDAERTQETLLAALAKSDGLLAERAQILNSLGTFYVVLGAFGAARALLEHGADLAKRLGDAMGEAIACGQLGAAAIAQGEREDARRFLQRQEWLASQIGDAFGRARALVFLAELSLDLGRPDDAVDLAGRATAVAASVSPPLAMWLAYAGRVRGRALQELGDPTAPGELDDALGRFRAMGNRLGEALVRWDVARSGGGGDADWFAAAWELGSLGLAQRVAELVADRRRLVGASGGDALDEAVAACSQGYPHLESEQEVELVYRRPEALSAFASRRVGGRRNLSRLAALVVGPPGLVVAAVVHPALGGDAVPSSPVTAVVVGGAPSLALWAWRLDAQPSEIAGDLRRLRDRLPGLRAALGRYAEARIVGLPVAGEATARLSGVAAEALIASAYAAAPGTLLREASVPWDAALADWS